MVQLTVSAMSVWCVVTGGQVMNRFVWVFWGRRLVGRPLLCGVGWAGGAMAGGVAGRPLRQMLVGP